MRASHQTRNRNFKGLIVSHLLGLIKTLNIIYAHIFTAAFPQHAVLFVAKHFAAQNEAFNFSCALFSFDCSFLPHKVFIEFALRFIRDMLALGFSCPAADEAVASITLIGLSWCSPPGPRHVRTDSKIRLAPGNTSWE